MRLLLWASLLLVFVACNSSNTAVDSNGSTVTRIGTEVGNRAPDFTLLDTSGKALSLSQLRGQVVLLDFWASWCAPCIAQLPAMKTVLAKYRDQGFIILGVSSDFTTAAWKSYIGREGLDWRHVYDAGDPSGAFATYNVRAIPQTYLLDRDGVIVQAGLHGDQLDTAIQSVLKK
jgi:peroxiredoxin